METAGKVLPSGLSGRWAALIAVVRLVAAGSDEQAADRHMALAAFTIRIIGAALAFVSQIALARMMGEFEYGIFVFVWVLAVLLGNLSCLGLPTAIIRFLPQYRAVGALAEARGLIATARGFVLTSAGMLTAIGLCILWVVSGTIKDFYVGPLALGLMTLPMIALGDVLDGTARANHWPIMALSPTFLVRPALILAFLFAALFFGVPGSAVTAAAAGLAAALATVVLQFAVVTRRLGRRYPAGPKAIELGIWTKAALPIFVIEGIGYLLTNADVAAVGLFLSPEQVAVYFAAAKTMALVHFVQFSVKAAAGPRFSAIIAENDPAKLSAFTAEAARWSFWPALAIGLVVLAAGDFLLSLFGAAFTAGRPLMTILFAGILAKALVGPCELLLIMAGRQTLCGYLYAGVLAVAVVLNVVLIPAFGIQGAAAASAAAMSLEALLLYLAVRRALGIVSFAFARSATITPNARLAA